MARMGHKDAFPPPRPSVRCGFSQGTFAGQRARIADPGSSRFRPGTARFDRKLPFAVRETPAARDSKAHAAHLVM